MLHSCWSISFVMIVLKTRISCSRKYLKKRNSFGNCVKKKKKILSLSPPFLFSAWEPSNPPRAPHLLLGPAQPPPPPFPLSLSPADRPGPPVSSLFPNRHPALFSLPVGKPPSRAPLPHVPSPAPRFQLENPPPCARAFFLPIPPPRLRFPLSFAQGNCRRRS